MTGTRTDSVELSRGSAASQNSTKIIAARALDHAAAIKAQHRKVVGC